jgi:Uma2 family endonuclease
MIATQQLVSAEDFAQRHERDRLELVAGVVEEQPMPFPLHGKVCSLINYYLMGHVLTHDLGHVMGNDSFIRTRRNPDSVRGADVMFVSYARLPRGRVPAGLLDVVPELVVEVCSPSDRVGAVEAKASEYLAAGVSVVVVLDPDIASATLFRANELPVTLHNGAVLTIPDVLPGFSVPLHRLFG